MITNTIGIDIGTSHTVISERGGNILLCEPTIAVINPYTSELIAAGSEAIGMCGSICSDVHIVTPVKNGVISEFEVMRLLLKCFLQRIFKSKLTFFSPKAVVCVPHGMNDMQIAETIDTVRSSGIRDVKILERPIASCIGAGIDINSPVGSLIVEVGAGLTEVAAICMGNIVSCETISTAGDKMDETISAKISKRCGIKIGKKMAETIKLSLPENENIEICGRNINTGLPSTAVLPSKEISKSLEDDIRQIIMCIKHLLNKLPSALSADIASNGITLTGGASNTFGLCEAITENLSIPCNIAQKSDLCAAIGLGKYIGDKLSPDNTALKDNTA